MARKFVYLMSYISFRTKDEEAKLSGRERAYFSLTLDKLTLSILKDMYSGFGLNRMIDCLPEDCYLHLSSDQNFKRDFETWYRASGGGFGDCYLNFYKTKVDPFVLSLNTAILIGSDPINLMARLHGQCEIHAYFMPEDFNYFVKVIEDGLEYKVFREGQGWSAVLDLFKTAKTPIVTSYSVTDSFPDEGFDKLDEEPTLRISQQKQLFGEEGITAFDFLNDTGYDEDVH